MAVLMIGINHDSYLSDNFNSVRVTLRPSSLIQQLVRCGMALRYGTVAPDFDSQGSGRDSSTQETCHFGCAVLAFTITYGVVRV